MASGAVHLMGNLAPAEDTRMLLLNSPTHLTHTLHARRKGRFRFCVLAFIFNFPITVVSVSPGSRSVINQVSTYDAHSLPPISLCSVVY